MKNSVKYLRRRKYISKRNAHPKPRGFFTKSKSFTEGIPIGQSKEEKSIKKQEEKYRNLHLISVY
jgi:hypothetical protein